MPEKRRAVAAADEIRAVEEPRRRGKTLQRFLVVRSVAGPSAWAVVPMIFFMKTEWRTIVVGRRWESRTERLHKRKLQRCKLLFSRKTIRTYDGQANESAYLLLRNCKDGVILSNLIIIFSVDNTDRYWLKSNKISTCIAQTPAEGFTTWLGKAGISPRTPQRWKTAVLVWCSQPLNIPNPVTGSFSLHPGRSIQLWIWFWSTA